jgi:hypothetical protein
MIGSRSIFHRQELVFMSIPSSTRFSGQTTVFHDQALPEPAIPSGYAALIDAYQLVTPLPRTLYAIGEHHRISATGGWKILTPRHQPAPTLEGHLTFALKYEGLDLTVLKRLFQATGPNPIEDLVRRKPTGAYARRLWFLYEWLFSCELDLAGAMQGAYTQVLDPAQQFAVEGTSSKRHRVINNLPGTPAFCPLVFRTEKIDGFIDLDLPARARRVVAAVPRDLLARTAAFLLMADSKSSYAIEGERPPHNRIERWGRAIGEAGKHPLSIDELLRLQKLVIGDDRFVQLGLRDEGGFIGEHDRDTRLPLPVHISARAEDLPSLVDGMVGFERGPALKMDPVVAASILAFGFVYIHPFVDGNGRIHRYLIHHALAARGFNPPGVVFPVSAAILERIDDYRLVLEDYSKRLLPVVTWEATKDGNVDVRNDTADFYRFFDATTQTEFLFECVQKTIDEDLPREAEFLARYDSFRVFVLEEIADMPDRTIDLLFRFLRQNNGRISGRAREKEFSALTDTEVTKLEAAYIEEFGGRAA